MLSDFRFVAKVKRQVPPARTSYGFGTRRASSELAASVLTNEEYVAQRWAGERIRHAKRNHRGVHSEQKPAGDARLLNGCYVPLDGPRDRILVSRSGKIICPGRTVRKFRSKAAAGRGEQWRVCSQASSANRWERRHAIAARRQPCDAQPGRDEADGRPAGCAIA